MNAPAQQDFTPSDVTLEEPPLRGTFGQLEMEVAAGWLVRACQAKGKFDPCTFMDIADVIRRHLPLHKDPCDVLDADFDGLVRGGFAEFEVCPYGTTLRFTTAGLERLRRWVSPRASG